MKTHKTETVLADLKSLASWQLARKLFWRRIHHGRARKNVLAMHARCIGTCTVLELCPPFRLLFGVSAVSLCMHGVCLTGDPHALTETINKDWSDETLATHIDVRFRHLQKSSCCFDSKNCAFGPEDYINRLLWTRLDKAKISFFSLSQPKLRWGELERWIVNWRPVIEYKPGFLFFFSYLFGFFALALWLRMPKNLCTC